MNNEIGRKITSLTLMTIMIAGGMTFAIPGVMPAAHAQANANLFVSVEESVISDRFGGPMVIEVVVNDPDLKEIDEAESEPNVEVNGQDLRMAQADDGNWYGYFADKTMALAADALVAPVGAGGINGTSIDFGLGCTKSSASAISGVSFSDTEGVFFSHQTAGTGAGVPGVLSACAGAFVTNPGGGTEDQNVIRENRTLNDNALANGIGQIGILDFPVIQLYDFTAGGDAKIVYNIGGGSPQTVIIEFDDALDSHSASGISLDRPDGKYPRSASVHMTINDVLLNIDPTDQDSWSFGTNNTNSSTTYQVFNEDGEWSQGSLGLSGGSGNPTVAPLDLQPSLGGLNFGDLGALFIDYDADGSGTFVLNIRDNTNQNYTFDNTGAANDASYGHQAGAGIISSVLGGTSAPVTFVETESSTGIFENTDEGDTSDLFVTPGALRGTTAVVDYNDSASSIRVTFYFGTIDMDASALGGEWNSGEEIPVSLVDQDLNLNSKTDEDIDLSDAAFALVPSLQIGAPITLEDATGVVVPGVGVGGTTVGPSITGVDIETANAGGDYTVQAFSKRANIGIGPGGAVTLDPAGSGSDIVSFQFPDTAAALGGFIFNGSASQAPAGAFGGKFSMLNYDIRSLEPTFTGATINITIADGAGGHIGGPNGTGLTSKGGGNGVNGPIAGLNTGDFQGLIDVTNADLAAIPGPGTISVIFNFTGTGAGSPGLVAGNYTAVVDFFNFGQAVDGVQPANRFNNAIYRLELEESGDNTGTFVGSVEYLMLNQLNVNQSSTYTGGIDPISDAIEIIVHEDLTDEDAPRINYLDLGADGVSTQIADQQEAPTHSGVVSFDSSTYKVADTVTITLEDADLNVDVETIDVFTVVTTNIVGAPDDAFDQVGLPNYGQNTAGDNFGRLLDVTFDDELWRSGTLANAGACAAAGTPDDGLGATGFTLGETGADTGVFTGDFQIPATYCQAATGALVSVTGTDVEVNYVDYRDASGEIIEVGDGAGIRANTGSISLDRTVYPVPFGDIADYGIPSVAGVTVPATALGDRSLFPIHQTGMAAPSATTGLDVGETIGIGDLTVHIRVNDPDFDVSASGEDQIAIPDALAPPTAANVPPVKLTISRGSAAATLGFAGGASTFDGAAAVFDIVGLDGVGADVPAAGDDCGTAATPVIAPTTLCAHVNGLTAIPTGTEPSIRLFGPIVEIAPDSGIFESDITIRYTDGPSSPICPALATVAATAGRSEDGLFTHCILQGDILTVQYTDPTDASGDPNTVTDSATFDLRNGVLQSDKSVYIIGSDMILTLIEPDLDLDNDGAETWDLDLIEWDSDAATVTMGNKCTPACGPSFDPEPSDLRETGDSTGIFQIVIEIPDTLAGDKLERGEEIVLEYTDWGPSGADYVGDEDEDINLTLFTSNFGATVELDQKVYSWTDKVYITIVAPDHNFDSNLIDEIGNSAEDPIKVATRGSDIDPYKLVETGTDTGIFTGEVILTGFPTHDADGDGVVGDASGLIAGVGPTDGFLAADDDDGITVSFEFSEDETVVGSALIRWNIGEVQWLEASYPATGTGVVRVVDPDMNLNPEAVDNYDVDIWSDSDAGGIDLTVTETNEATGIFEGTVFFTITDESSGHRLRVSEGDTITAEYEDNTLPDPYTTADELDITGTSIIGTIVPPLERAPASGLRVVDAFGNSLGEVSVDQQVQITSDLANGQDRDQAFAYLVQVQDGNGVTVSLAWITGSLTAGQSFSPALSWIPDASGTYTATAFVWESVDNPTALSPPVTTSVNVN